jgi:uncharacterized protein
LGNIKRIAVITLIGVLLVSGYLAYKASGVGMDYDFEAFFSEKDPETKFFNDHRERFTSDNDFIFIALVNKKGIFELEFLKQVKSLVEDIAKDSLVESVNCITEMEEYVKAPFSSAVLSRPYLNIDNPSKYEKDSIRIFSHPEIAKVFIDRDATALLVNVQHRQYMSKEKCDVLVTTIRSHLEKYDFDEVKLAGRSIGMNYYVNQMIDETLLFIGLSMLLVFIFLAVAFRSVWGVWVPLTIIGMSMVWIVGFMGVVNQPINLILTTLPSIIFVVAMSDVMHLVSKYMEELRLGNSKIEAVRTAYKEVGKATLLTSLTTAAGFLTLLMIDMEPVQDFGSYTAIGVLLAFVLAYTLLPALLILTKAPKVSKRKNTETFWYKIMHPSFAWMLRKKFAVLLGFLILLGISIFGSTKVIADYFLLEDLKEGNELRETYEYFDQQFLGLRPFEMSVNVKEEGKSIYDYEVLQEMSKVEEYLHKDYEIENIFSVITILKVANRTNHAGQKSYYKLPSEEESKDYIERIRKFDKTGQLATFVDSTEKFARITSNIGDRGMIRINQYNEKLNEFLEKEINTDLVEFKLTGTGHLLDRNMSKLSRNLFAGLGLAVGIVSLLMGVLFRSVRMVLIALIPNILPLLMLGAILGFSGVELKVSTALVFTISFGIAVDDTIHFMSKLKIELNKGKSLMIAMRRTYLSTGRAIVLTSFILVGGFLMLMFSDFLGTFYIGLLISCTLIFALFADLFFLPVLMMYFFKPKKKKLKSE